LACSHCRMLTIRMSACSYFRLYRRVVHLDDFQGLMKDTYGLRDTERGLAATVAWLAEEFGELAQAVRKGTREEQLHELGDVLAWVASLAAQLDLSLEEAVDRFKEGCPRCVSSPCSCPDASMRS